MILISFFTDANVEWAMSINEIRLNKMLSSVHQNESSALKKIQRDLTGARKWCHLGNHSVPQHTNAERSGKTTTWTFCCSYAYSCLIWTSCNAPMWSCKTAPIDQCLNCRRLHQSINIKSAVVFLKYFRWIDRRCIVSGFIATGVSGVVPEPAVGGSLNFGQGRCWNIIRAKQQERGPSPD